MAALSNSLLQRYSDFDEKPSEGPKSLRFCFWNLNLMEDVFQTHFTAICMFQFICLFVCSFLHSSMLNVSIQAVNVSYEQFPHKSS